MDDFSRELTKREQKILKQIKADLDLKIPAEISGEPGDTKKGVSFSVSKDLR